MFKTKHDDIKLCKAKDCDNQFEYTKNKQYCSNLCSQRTRKANDKTYQAAYRAKHKEMTPKQKEVVAQKRRDYYESVKRDELQGQPLGDVEKLLKLVSENRPVWDHRCNTCGRGCSNKAETINEGDLNYCGQSCYDLKLTDEMILNRDPVYNSAKWRGETL